MASALLDLLAHIVVDFHVEDIGDEVEGILVILNFGIKPGKVKAIGKVVFINLAEVFVATTGQKLQSQTLLAELLSIRPSKASPKLT